MRFLISGLFLFILMSCGQKSSPSKGMIKQTDHQMDEYFTNVTSVDLLDIAMDVAIDLVGDKIIFKQAASDKSEGEHSVCDMNVNVDEAYVFKLDGSFLKIQTSSGEKISFVKVSKDATGILGSWTSKSFRGNQMMMRKFTFISENRLVMRTHCEG